MAGAMAVLCIPEVLQMRMSHVTKPCRSAEQGQRGLSQPVSLGWRLRLLEEVHREAGTLCVWEGLVCYACVLRVFVLMSLEVVLSRRCCIFMYIYIYIYP